MQIISLSGSKASAIKTTCTFLSAPININFERCRWWCINENQRRRHSLDPREAHLWKALHTHTRRREEGRKCASDRGLRRILRRHRAPVCNAPVTRSFVSPIAPLKKWLRYIFRSSAYRAVFFCVHRPRHEERNTRRRRRHSPQRTIFCCQHGQSPTSSSFWSHCVYFAPVVSFMPRVRVCILIVARTAGLRAQLRFAKKICEKLTLTRVNLFFYLFVVYWVSINSINNQNGQWVSVYFFSPTWSQFDFLCSLNSYEWCEFILKVVIQILNCAHWCFNNHLDNDAHCLFIKINISLSAPYARKEPQFSCITEMLSNWAHQQKSDCIFTAQLNIKFH